MKMHISKILLIITLMVSVFPTRQVYAADTIQVNELIHMSSNQLGNSRSTESTRINTSELNLNRTVSFSQTTKTTPYYYYFPIIMAGVNEVKLMITQPAGGSITADPAGTYKVGDQVTLRATANTGYTFKSWIGDAKGGSNTVTITLNENKTVSAVFELNQVTLSLTNPVGATITANPTGPYHYGDEVTLLASIGAGYSFKGWTGDVTGIANPVKITLNGNKSVGASVALSKSDVFYVASTGNDANPGTFEHPYKTIQHAVDSVKDPGDIVLVMPGEYHSYSSNNSDAIVVENKHGLPGQEIIIQAYDPNNKPVIINRSSGFRVINSSYVVIDGFEIRDYRNGGIAIYVSNNVIIMNNYLHLEFQGLCQSGEGLPKCLADGSGAGQPKGRKDNLGNYILEFDNSQNTGLYLCKSQDNVLTGNRIENVDEGIYIGSAGNVAAESCWTSYTPRTWSSGNVVEDNIILTALNEGIELKPDAIRTVVSNNLLKNSAGFENAAIEVRSAYNDIYENVIFGDNQFSKSGIRLVDESTCINPPNDEFGKSMLIYPKSTGYICGFGSTVHQNYVYYSQGNYYIPAINNSEKSAGNVIDHNTIVGGNDFGIISDAVSSTILNNLIIGTRGTKRALLSQIPSNRPIESDFNAYYPNKRTDGACIVYIAGATVGCETQQNSSYEIHSIFMPSNPVGSFQPATSPLKIDAECSWASLSAVSPEALKETIKTCSIPLNNSYGNQIINKASDGTNIGAAQ